MTWFHVIVSANQDRPVFTDGGVVLDIYKGMEAIRPAAGVHAYALMSSHMHMLVELGADASLGTEVARILAPAARNLNGRFQQAGGVFTRPFWRREVQGLAHFHVLPLYIHANVAPRANDWGRLDVGLRSSHAAWVKGVPPAWLCEGAVEQYGGDYEGAMRSFLAERAEPPAALVGLRDEVALTVCAVSRLTGVRTSTLCDPARGGKRDRMLAAWAIELRHGSSSAAAALGVERHAIRRWAGAVATDPDLRSARAILGGALTPDRSTKSADGAFGT